MRDFMEAKNFYVQTYGCTSNKFDSERMMGLLQQAGHKIVAKPEQADYFLLNTCAVKSQTEERVIHRMKELSKSNKKMIVAGCLTKINPERIKKVVPDFSAMIDTRSIHKITEVVVRTENGEKNIVEVSQIPGNKLLLPRFSFSNNAIVKISEGCLSRCSFCATKFARGDLYSYRPDDIRDNIRQGLKEGCKEFHLTSEDSSAYGRDLKTNLPDLLDSISEIEGNFFVRVGMMNPLHFKRVEIKNLIEAFKSEKIFKFLHLCVQSGSNKILKDMRRGYKVEDFVNYVAEFRKEIPQLTLETDVIVGFPTETDDDFQQTVELVKKIKPDVVNISRYGSRPKTDAAKMKQIDPRIVNERSGILHDLVNKISLEKNKQWIEWKGSVIVDQKVKDFVVARNFAYKSVVIKENIPLGKIIDVEILHADKHSIFAQTV
jgi:MiaB-like tRNA modifying enzyme